MTLLQQLAQHGTDEQKKTAIRLGELGINTENDLLLADESTLNRSNIPKSILERFRTELIYSSCRPVRADKLVTCAVPKQRLSTSFPELDGILQGGLLQGSITEFAGPTNTGKTVLLSNIIVSRLVSKPNVQAVYIDTLGTFNPSLLQSLLPSSSDASVLDRIHLMTALDMVTLVEACEQVKQSLSQKVPIELLVIDTISSPISLVMNKGQLQGHALMQSFSHLLRVITTQYNLTTLLINAAVKTDLNALSAFTTTKVKPALGATWTFSADTCILMHRAVENKLIAEVLRSRSGETGWTALDPSRFQSR